MADMCITFKIIDVMFTILQLYITYTDIRSHSSGRTRTKPPQLQQPGSIRPQHSMTQSTGHTTDIGMGMAEWQTCTIILECLGCPRDSLEGPQDILGCPYNCLWGPRWVSGACVCQSSNQFYLYVSRARSSLLGVSLF